MSQRSMLATTSFLSSRLFTSHSNRSAISLIDLDLLHDCERKSNKRERGQQSEEEDDRRETTIGEREKERERNVGVKLLLEQNNNNNNWKWWKEESDESDEERVRFDCYGAEISEHTIFNQIMAS